MIINDEGIVNANGWSNNVTNNPMKDVKGAWRLSTLFWEHRRDGYTPLFTLQDADREIDGVVYTSLKRVYLSYEHIPGAEYDFALEVLGSWEHWLRLCAASHVKEHIQSWREELEVKTRANAIKSVIKTSLDGSAAGATAAKWLAEKGYAPKRGRPSKAERAGHLKQEERIHKEIQDDMERIGLKAVK